MAVVVAAVVAAAVAVAVIAAVNLASHYTCTDAVHFYNHSFIEGPLSIIYYAFGYTK